MDRREGGGGACVHINPVRKKKQCGRRLEFVMSAFKPDAAVAKRSRGKRARRFGLHTVDPPRSQPWERTLDRDRREWLHAEPEVFNAKVEAFLARCRGWTSSSLGCVYWRGDVTN